MICIPVDEIIAQSLAGLVLLESVEHRQRAEIPAALKAHVVQLESRAHFLVCDRSVKSAVLLKSDFANMTIERGAVRIEFDVVGVWTLIVVRAVTLCGGDRVLAARHMTPCNEAARHPSAVRKAMLEVETAECRGLSKESAEHFVVDTPKRRCEHATDHAFTVAEIATCSAGEIVRERLDRSRRSRPIGQLNLCFFFGRDSFDDANAPRPNLSCDLGGGGNCRLERNIGIVDGGTARKSLR